MRSDQGGDEEMTPLNHGWTEEQVRATRKPQPCRRHPQDTVEGQLEFISYELRNSYQIIGTALDKAKTVQEAKDVVELFVAILSLLTVFWSQPTPAVSILTAMRQ
jgi:hypothetical protein